MSNARNKLNAASVRGIVLFAGLVALVCRSWMIFWFLMVVLLAASCLAGDIRAGGKRR